MGHRIASFQFDVDGSFATGITTATANYTTGHINMEAINFAIVDMDNIKTAINELLDQPVGDGVTITQQITAGGNTLTWDPVAQTIKLGALQVWAKNKALSFVAAIDAYLP